MIWLSKSSRWYSSTKRYSKQWFWKETTSIKYPKLGISYNHIGASTSIPMLLDYHFNNSNINTFDLSVLGWKENKGDLGKIYQERDQITQPELSSHQIRILDLTKSLYLNICPKYWLSEKLSTNIRWISWKNVWKKAALKEVEPTLLLQKMVRK